eukprot:363403-Chlamydomonas_euryale.AAC.2
MALKDYAENWSATNGTTTINAVATFIPERQINLEIEFMLENGQAISSNGWLVSEAGPEPGQCDDVGDAVARKQSAGHSGSPFLTRDQHYHLWDARTIVEQSCRLGPPPNVPSMLAWTRATHGFLLFNIGCWVNAWVQAAACVSMHSARLQAVSAGAACWRVPGSI